MSEETTPPARSLTATERDLLDAFLTQDFAGVDRYRLQVEGVTAYSSCQCGCGSIGLLQADGTRAPRSAGLQTVPIDALVLDDRGTEIGGLILFVRDGLLDDLEVYSYGREPLALPKLDHVRFY